MRRLFQVGRRHHQEVPIIDKATVKRKQRYSGKFKLSRGTSLQG